MAKVNEGSQWKAKSLTDREERTRLTVLLSLKAPDGTTRFVDQIVAFKPQEETIKYFSWRTALLGSYDVLHVHWPEWMLRHSRRGVRWVKYGFMLLLLLRLSILPTAVVRTIHNVEPHRPGGSIERFLVAAIDRRTTEYVVLNPFTPSPGPTTLIRHGSYVTRFRDYVKHPMIPGRILFFGRIEPYKNVNALIDQFACMDSDEPTLRIVGSLDESAFPDRGERLRQAVEATRRVTARFEFVSDEALVEEITKSQLVVLHYTEMHNSGALLVALSLGRVVYAVPSEVNKWIQGEVGPDWLILDRELTGTSLARALDHAKSTGDGSARTPYLDNREWGEVAREHYAVYQKAVKSVRRRGDQWKA